MMIFPLSWPGKIVLIFIAILLGLIFWAMHRPDHFRKFIAKIKGNSDAGKKE